MKTIEEYAIDLVADGAEHCAEDDLNEDGEIAEEDHEAAMDLALDIARAIRANPQATLALVAPAEVVPGRREAAILRWAAARIRDECRHPENDGGLWCAARAQDLDLWAAGIEDTARIKEEN